MDLEDMDWLEIKISKVLGITRSQLKSMDEDDLVDFLLVTDESLKRYYHYLNQHLKFPFRAFYEEEIRLFEDKQHEVNCIRLDQDMKYNDFYGVFVECKKRIKKVRVPLGEINVDEDNENYDLIELYKDWFWNFR